MVLGLLQSCCFRNCFCREVKKRNGDEVKYGYLETYMLIEKVLKEGMYYDVIEGEGTICSS